MPAPHEIGPFPQKAQLTAIQLALVDNGPVPKTTKTGRKSNGARHKLIIEAYDQPLATLNKKVYFWKRNIGLRGPNPFLTLIDKQLGQGTIQKDYHTLLGDVVTGIPLDERDGYMFGQVWENNDGWRFFPFQYVVVKMPKGDDNPVVWIMNYSEEICTDRMNTYFSNRNVTHTGYIELTA
ncbi:hypothetical protein ACRBEV_25650 [Methylobacterium phyllosphaerae]